MSDRAVKARELLERGAYLEAAALFQQVGEYASAARAFVCAKDFRRAAFAFEQARLPLDAARLYMLMKEWAKAADLYTSAGDATRAQLAREQIAPAAPAPAARPAAPPAPAAWPEGPLWSALKAGDVARAAELYLKPGGASGWQLVEDARGGEPLRALAEALVLARDFALAGEAFRRMKDEPRAAQCLSQAGLNEEAADLFMRCGQKLPAAQHLERARAWEQAAAIYQEAGKLLEAARCHEKNDDPVKAAGLYLKDRKPDLALPLLQSVPPAHKSFAPCRLLAAKILYQKGERDLATALLEPLIQGSPKGEEALDAFYQAALLLEQGGEPERAREAYGRLQQARFDYRDVRVRLEALAQQAASAVPPPVDAVVPADAPVLDFSPLRHCSLFDRLDGDDLRILASSGKEVEPPAGQVVVGAGQHADRVYVVLSGGLTITPDPAKRDLAVGFLGPGDYVGLGTLIQGPAQANALVAQAGTRLLGWSPADLDSLLQTRPELGLKFYRSVAEHVARRFAAESGRLQGGPAS